MDIHFVNMPFAALERPSAALGLLAAVLKNNGFSCRVWNANLHYAAELGFTLYDQVTMTKPQDMVGEWLFSDQLFPESEDEARAYVGSIHKRSALLARENLDELHEHIAWVRRMNSRFLNRLARRILAHSPKIVGCTSTFFQHMPSLALLKTIKALSPETVTIMGGANCEGEMGLSNHQRFSFLDFVVSGDGDQVIVPLARDILDSRGSLAELDVPPFVFAPIHRRQQYPPLSAQSTARSSRQEVDALPLPDYDDYFSSLARLDVFKGHVKVSVPVETSRGCWWGQKRGCTFCGLNGERKSFRAKKAETVMTQLHALHERYGVSRFQVTDNIMSPQFHRSLVPMLIEAGSPYTLFFETKTGLSDHELFEMKRAGIIWIQAGIESLDSRCLTLMNKGCKAWENIRMLKFCRQNGIFVGWNFMCRFPGEKDEWYDDMARLLPLLHHLQPAPRMVKLRFDRFSQYFNQQQRFELHLEPYPQFVQTYRFSESTADGLSYFFKDKSQRELDENPFLSALLTGDGFSACNKALSRWNEAYDQDEPPVLEKRTRGGQRWIRDTRSCRVTEYHDLQDLEWDLLEALDEGLSAKELSRWAEKRSLSRDDLQYSLDSLEEGKLVLHMDGVWLSLVFLRPTPAKPHTRDYPGGIFTRTDSAFPWWEDEQREARRLREQNRPEAMPEPF